MDSAQDSDAEGNFKPTAKPVDISWPLERSSNSENAPWSPSTSRTSPPNGNGSTSNSNHSSKPPTPPIASSSLILPIKDLLPGGQRSQAGISLRAFGLGITLGISILLTTYALYNGSRLWRPPFFLSALSLFHFLEFYTHARYNTPQAVVKTFLLFDNGRAYNIAHTLALIETLINSVWLPDWQARFSLIGFKILGLAMLLLGQTVRTAAMVTAGTNFNHQVQTRRREGHQLVSTGIYSMLRHPSYFGFFWWAIGGQVTLGNPICCLGYVAILWRFFSRRIRAEERYLIGFFGDEYVEYKKRTGVGIPLIS